MAGQLSHRGCLPSWNRPGLSRRSGTDVRKLVRDQLPTVSSTAASSGEGEGVANFQHTNRIVQLEKNILFLKQQHHDTLEQLHKEIEWLKKENKELNFKLVMCRCGGKNRTTNRHLRKEDVEYSTPVDDMRTIFLEEIRELKNTLAAERSKNNHLMRVIEKKVLEGQKNSSFDGSDSVIKDGSAVKQSFRGVGHPAIALVSRPPTLEECETTIKELEIKNHQQEHELLQIKADLRDVLYSHKWTPDAFLMARAYVCDGNNGGNVGEGRILPQVDPHTSRETLEKAYQRVKEEVTLPALRPKVPSMVAERYRRSQAIRGRVGRSLF